MQLGGQDEISVTHQYNRAMAGCKGDGTRHVEKTLTWPGEVEFLFIEQYVAFLNFLIVTVDYTRSMVYLSYHMHRSTLSR
nr:hypothetical protein CFP56_69852 [Quercus suber]